MNAPHRHEGVSAEMLAPPLPGEDWDWWRNGLHGQAGTFSALRPHTGFYRFRPRMAERGSPCAIWFHDGQWVALIDGEPVADVAHAWRFSHKFPIQEETYGAVLGGAPWPDEVAATEGTPVAGHNSATPEALVLDEIAQADMAFTAWLEREGGVIRTEEQDQVVKGYDTRIAKLRKDAEAARKAERDFAAQAGGGGK